MKFFVLKTEKEIRKLRRDALTLQITCLIAEYLEQGGDMMDVLPVLTLLEGKAKVQILREAAREDELDFPFGDPSLN